MKSKHCILHTGRDIMVPSPGGSSWVKNLLLRCGCMVHRLHLCRDDKPPATVPRRLGTRARVCVRVCVRVHACVCVCVCVFVCVCVCVTLKP